MTTFFKYLHYFLAWSLFSVVYGVMCLSVIFPIVEVKRYYRQDRTVFRYWECRLSGLKDKLFMPNFRLVKQHDRYRIETRRCLFDKWSKVTNGISYEILKDSKEKSKMIEHYLRIKEETQKWHLRNTSPKVVINVPQETKLYQTMDDL